MTLYIKNMVCNRCIKVVKEELTQLGFTINFIDLGEVEIEESTDETGLAKIKARLQENGFELIEDSKQKLIDRIKSHVIKKIHHENLSESESNFSDVIEKEIGRDYSSLSKLFSSVEGVTIEHYIILQKIEKVKELLKYGDKTLSEISYQLGYNSVNHLSSQFKKQTGMTATEFKNNTSIKRKPLDKIL